MSRVGLRQTGGAPERDVFAALPSGRHGLPREEVERSQRERLVRAMAEVSAERGYASVSVADVIKRAGVSRATFYGMFSSKEDCFIAAVEAAVDFVLSPEMMAAAASQPTPREALSHGIREFLERFVEAPAMARLFMVDAAAAGPETVRRRFDAIRLRADTITGLLGLTGDENRFAGRAYVMASDALVTEALLLGEVEELRGLHDPLLRLADRMLFTAQS